MPRPSALDDTVEPGHGVETGDGGAVASGERRRSTPRARLRTGTAPAALVPVLLAILAVPLLVALAVLRTPRWFPVLDLAWTELRVRDVGTTQSPLIGLAGRIGTPGNEGSHPGPLSFWALAPPYRVLGATPWAMQAASVALHLVAMGVALWTARRRGGVALVLGIAAVLAVLARAYGTATLTEAWNPYLPVLWWVVLLLAVWSVLEGDLPLLPVAAFAGSFCAQTHIPYLGLAGGLGALVVVVVLVVAARRGAARGTGSGTVLRWAGIALGVVAVLWLPPVIDELVNEPGNLTKLWDHFSDPPEEAIGAHRGAEVLLVHLNPWRLLTGDIVTARWPQTASVVPGALLLVAWAGSAVVAWRSRHATLLRLDAVLAAGLLLGLVSLSRIFGFVWYYLSLWAGGITALVLLAVAWTAAVAVAPRLRARSRDRVAALAVAALAVVFVGATASFTVDATSAEPPDARLSRMLASLSPVTAEALEAGAAGAGGRDGRYLVTWSDSVNIGAAGFGLLLELERRGFDVATTEGHQAGATTHRVIEREAADTEVHLAVGPDIPAWRSRGDAVEVAYADPRDDRQRAEYEAVRDDVIGELRAAGLTDLVPGVDENVFVTANNDRMPVEIRDRMQRLIDLGLPAAVFVVPVTPQA